MVTGCVVCKDTAVPVVEYDTSLGYYQQKCTNKDLYDFTKENVPCYDIGYTQRWTGYIPEE